MVEKMDISNVDEKTKQFLDHINKEKVKVLTLSYLSAILMLLEVATNIYVNLQSVIIFSFILTAIVNFYAYYKLDIYKIKLSYTLSAIKNNMSIKEWLSMGAEQIIEKELKIVKINWRSLVKEYISIYLSVFICMGVLLFAVTKPFFNM